MKTITVSLPFDQDIKEYVQQNYPLAKEFRIVSKSLDARKAPLGRKPLYQYQVVLIEDTVDHQITSEQFEDLASKSKTMPIIVGTGPAGLFCAIRLAEYGIPSIILERGDRVPKRMQKISKYWRYGELDSESNVCFGEGGAGLYSDGKLITRVKSEYIPYVMKKFVEFGAPPETEYLANPHLGSNKIRTLIGVMTKELENKKCDLKFNSKVVDFIFDDQKRTKGVILENGERIYSDTVIVATGHSAREIYHIFESHQVAMKPKDFAIGVRIEHHRKFIDQIQHGQFADDPLLGAARYRLSFHNEETNRGTYSFCMCPGGYVLASSTDKEGIVTNGMSNNNCNSAWSNAALVVTVHTEQDCKVKEEGVLAGLNFIESIEKKAYSISKELASGREIPAQNVVDFLENKVSSSFLKTSTPSQLVAVDLRNILPPFVIEHLKDALYKFDDLIDGFSQGGILLAPETRTSSPVTIIRDANTLESISHQGLYPAGEGAGYAGGITSAAVDGVKIAESIKNKLKHQA